MPKITGVYLFAVGGFFVESSMLGTREEFHALNRHCVLTFPSSQVDFGIPEEYANRDGLIAAKQSMRHEDTNETWHTIYIVKLEIDGTAEITAADFRDGNGDAQLASRIDEELQNDAEEILHRIVTRVHSDVGQYWVSMSVERPRMVWLRSIYDHRGERIPAGHGGTAILRRHGETDAALSPSLFSRVLEKAANDEPSPPLSNTLLNDAKHIALTPDYPDYRQTLLFAAIACEIKSKDAAQRLATSDQALLVEIMVGKGWSMRIADLLDVGFKAICGQSLKESNSDLYGRIRRLLDARNRMAHGRHFPITKNSIAGHLDAATELFSWLDSLGS